MNAGNNWSASWSDLDKYQDDLSTEIVYTAALTEDPALHQLVSNQNGVITYQYDATLTTKDVPVSLAWSDEDASGRADQVVVQLYADGVAQTGKTVTLNADNNWSATFAKLAEKKRVSASETADIVYTFKVLTRVNNYTSSISDSEGSIVITMTYSASNAQKFSNIGKAGTLDGIPSEATGANTHFLTDLLNGRNKKVISQYIADGGKYKSFENYDGKVQVFSDGTKQTLVENADTMVNGVTYQPTDIALGANGTVYSEGLSFEVSAPTADDTYITYDLTGMNATNFYAVAGITDEANDIMTKPFFLTFEVWGSKDGTTYEKLGYAEALRSYLVAEFNVDITGYNYLKLTAYNTGDLNDGISAVWADALVYTSISSTPSTPTEPTDPTEPSVPDDDLTDSGDVDTSAPMGYTASADGSYTGITKAAEGSYVALSDAKYVGDSYILPSGSTKRYVRIDTTDLNENNPANAIIGKANTKFAEHLTLHPTAKTDKTYSFVELDLTGLDVDRFYSAVGISAAKGKENGMGVVFNVFGYDETKSDYVLIGTSSDVHGYESGEFDIDITGYKKLKLEVALASDSADHYSRTSSWCNVAVYKYDENGSAPETPEEDSGELPGVYTSSSDGSYKWISDAKGGKVTYLSKLSYTSSSNSSAGNPTTKNEPYGEAGKKIIIGQKNTGYTYGLGVHPKSGSAQAYTIYDLSSLEVDRFYAAVGITNEKGKNGSSEGVIFQVYADYDGTGSYKLLAESETISKKGSGEFHVDITGAKSLKLVTLSATGNHASSASAWAAACVYKYDANGSKPTSYTTVGASNASSSTTSDNTGLKHTAGFTPSVDGEYSGVDAKHTRSIIYLSDLQYLDASNTTNSAYPNGQPTTLDHPYNDKTSLIILGQKERAFFDGLGVHPKSPSSPVDGTVQSWTTYDVSDLDADRFYAAVGLTNDKGKEGASKGVIFRVYADYTGDGTYKELAHSGCLDGRDSGEFDLDITGVKTLKLTVEAASTTHTSSASAWANACVYDSTSVTEGVGKPEIKEPTKKPVDEDAQATEPVEGQEGAENEGKMTTGSIIGIVAICLLCLLVILLVILLILKNRKLRK